MIMIIKFYIKVIALFRSHIIIINKFICNLLYIRSDIGSASPEGIIFLDLIYLAMGWAKTKLKTIKVNHR